MIELECELVASREHDVKTHNPEDHLGIRKSKERYFHHFCVLIDIEKKQNHEEFE